MKTKSSIGFLIFYIVVSQASAQNTWTQKANLTGINRAACIAFSTSTDAYVGMGYNFSQFPAQQTDLWKYNPATNTWTAMASFPGAGLSGASAFSIGTKGYVVGGFNSSASVVNQLWEYDAVANLWTQKTSCPGAARDFAVAFSINGKGYFGTGYDASSTSFNDFWEYNPTTNSWLQRADVPGPPRSSAIGFGIGNKGYVGAGFTVVAVNDFWQYDPSNNTWTQKANIGTQAIDDASTFVINGEGYICTGYINSTPTNQLLKYNTLSDTWTVMTSLTGPSRTDACGFAVGNKGYISCGNDASFTHLKDLWEYAPSTPLPVSLLSFSAEVNGDNVVDIDWATASEINNSRFIVQRSLNTIDYSDVATIDGAENSNMILHYVVSDESPVNGINYYRLCQVDFDGTRTYYDPVAVRIGGISNILVYPNPVSNFLWIEAPDNVQATISDVYGKLVSNQDVPKGISSTSVKELPGGVYTLRILDGDAVFIRKIIVQK